MVETKEKATKEKEAEVRKEIDQQKIKDEAGKKEQELKDKEAKVEMEKKEERVVKDAVKQVTGDQTSKAEEVLKDDNETIVKEIAETIKETEAIKKQTAKIQADAEKHETLVKLATDKDFGEETTAKVKKASDVKPAKEPVL